MSCTCDDFRRAAGALCSACLKKLEAEVFLIVAHTRAARHQEWIDRNPDGRTLMGGLRRARRLAR